MVKSWEESAKERRDYIAQARASFQNAGQEDTREESLSESGEKYSTLGIRIIIAVLLFACFVYCDQEKITFQGYGAQDVLKQIEWNPLPMEELEKLWEKIPVSVSPKSTTPRQADGT